MRRVAIVIGIDRYANPDWNLDYAVSDALAFREWCLDTAGMGEGDVHLLLSPREGDRRVTVPFSPARRSDLNAAVLRVAADADELFFFYAGHGVSAPGAKRTGVQEPVFLPADLSDFESEAHLLLGFSQLIDVLGERGPKKQFFFIAACRGFALDSFRSELGGRVGPTFRLQDDGRQAVQHVLYATSTGQNANDSPEFREHLLRGLTGHGRCLEHNPASNRWDVSFSKLARFVVREMGGERTDQGPQVPWPTSCGPDKVLISFRRDEIPSIAATVRVQPGTVHPVCSVSAQSYFPQTDTYMDVKGEGPPVAETFDVRLFPGPYRFVANAEGREATRHHEVYDDTVVDLQFQPTLRLGGGGRGRVGPRSAPYLTVYTPDRFALIRIFHPNGRVSESRAVWNGAVTAGIHRVQLVAPEGVLEEQVIDVASGQQEFVFLKAPPAPSLAEVSDKNLIDEDGYLQTGNETGVVAAPSLLTLLAMIGFRESLSAQEKMGIFPDLAPFELVVPRGWPFPSLIVLYAGIDEGVEVASSGLYRGFDPIPGLSGSGAQFLLFPEEGPARLRLRIGSGQGIILNPPVDERFLTVVVLAREQGRLRQRIHTFPTQKLLGQALWPTDKTGLFRKADRVVRAFESDSLIAASHLDSGDSDMMLYGKWVDPIMGCLAGYTLMRRNEAHRYIGYPSDIEGNWPSQSAMQNMQRFFGFLPDSHILAGMANPEIRDEAFTRASQMGPPVFTDGFLALYAWMKQRKIEQDWAEEIAPRIIPGSAFLTYLAPDAPWPGRRNEG